MFHCLLAACAVLLLLGTCGRARTNNDQEPAGAGYNHLAGQQSPYLLQHARNPVDWYPWGEEALDKAAAEGKLLVISVGYAACHWCHVMEHESFADSLVAAVMNESFVNIKVDREERPDVDEVYMTACQLTAQRGCGWPLNAIALPDGRPIWAGTYFPKDQWLKILRRFAGLQISEPEQMEEYAAGLVEELARQQLVRPEAQDEQPLRRAEIGEAAGKLLESMDARWGGTRGEPKFPMPVLHEFLLEYAYHSGDEAARDAVLLTLDRMAAGGIYDQLGGGFARYSTDERWLVPHFEKMLYDNAQLVSLYAHAYQLTGRENYARIVRQTLAFLERSLAHPAGAFYASLDADTEGEEGATYVWSYGEIATVLGEGKLTDAFTDYYQVTKAGNWEGSNILTRPADATKAAAIAEKHRYADAATMLEEIAAAAEKLLAVREARAQPTRDDKVLTAWNALMITAYTQAYRALGDDAYRQRATRLADFLWDNLRKEDGRLDRSYKDGSSAINAFLDDYALLAQAYVELYQVTFAEHWLERATELIDYTELHFYDRESGLYCYTSDLDPPLITPTFPVADKVIPAANSVLARVLHKLGTLTANEALVARSRSLLAGVRDRLVANGPRFYANWARLYQEILEPTYEVAILGADAGARRSRMSKEYLPNVLFLGGAEEGSLELLRNKLNPGETTIYVCLEKVCQLPVTDPERALGQLKRVDF